MNERKAGVILSYLSMGAHSLIQLVYVPMLLYYLTKEQYGIYQLMGSLIAYLSIMDFGLSNTTTRYLSQAYARNDAEQAQNIINTSDTIYGSISLLLLVVGGIFYACITPLYKNALSAADLMIAKQIFVVMLVNITFSIPGNIFTAVINAHERFVFLRGLNLIKVLLQPLLVWGIMAWKASVLNLVLLQTGFNLCMVFVNYAYCRIKLHARFSFNFRHLLLMRELTGFSVFVFLHSLMDTVYWRLGQLVLGVFAGAVAVANYAISIQLATFTIFLPATLGGVFLPALSAIFAKSNDVAEMDVIFCKVGRLQFMFTLLLLTGFAFLGKTFISLWVGPGYNVCYYVAMILMAAYVLDVAQNIGIPILQAMKKHAFRAYVYVAMAVLNVALCIPLAKRYGELGCAVATAICLLLGSGLAINWYYARIGLNLKRFFGNLGQITSRMLPTVAGIGCCFWLFPLQNTWFSLVLHGMLITGIYGICMWLLAFNDYEKHLFLEPIQKLTACIKRYV